MKAFATNYKNAFLAFSFLVFPLAYSSNAQVGIETTDPKSTFEVNGSEADPKVRPRKS